LGTLGVGITIAVLLASSGCDVMRSGQRLDARAVTRAIAQDTGISFEMERAPSGLPSLAATYTGETANGRVVVLDFYTRDGTRNALGDSRSGEHYRILVRENLVLLYEPGAGDLARRDILKAALAEAGYRE
jgi:hypothetical protein